MRARTGSKFFVCLLEFYHFCCLFLLFFKKDLYSIIKQIVHKCNGTMPAGFGCAPGLVPIWEKTFYHFPMTSIMRNKQHTVCCESDCSAVSHSRAAIMLKRYIFIYITALMFISGLYTVASGHHHFGDLSDIKNLHIFCQYLKNPVAKQAATNPVGPAVILAFSTIFFMVIVKPPTAYRLDFHTLKKRHLKEHASFPHRAPPAHTIMII